MQDLSRELRQSYSTRGAPPEVRSLNSSFDYVDLNMNEALKAVGETAKSGRGKTFFKKEYKEDKAYGSADESVFERQLKMPNV